uniref:Uncharacterized protein n=1 Tax=Nelumbo nucifera TaxID=4432 RepID=A0A822Y8A8_NELNU|nr:TPA_asm: hypothetical protein HUJ06_029751 [Nelumbo nucifera]
MKHQYKLQVVNLQEEIEFLENQVANLANDAVSHQSSQQATSEPDYWFQFSSQRDPMDAQYCLNQQPLHHPSNAAVNATSTLMLDNDEMNAQLPPLYMLDNQSSSYCHSATSPDALERILSMGMQQEILPTDPWFGNAT